MARTPQSTLTCTMRSSEHAAHRLLMHSVQTSHLWLKVSPCVSFHIIHACALVFGRLIVSPHPSLYFLVPFLFQLHLMSNSAPDEISIEDPLCNSSLGSMVTLDYVTHLTLWSVNKLARSITKWTKACDKRLNRLISFIYHTCEIKQYCYVVNTAKQCRLGLFQDSDFAGDLEDSKSTSGGTLCVFGSHTFVPISWMCKKRTAVSHSSKESEIISLTLD